MPRYRQSMSEALQEVVSDNETFDEAMKWEVKIAGLPTFYSDGKSRGQVRQALRKMLKRPDDIESIERTTPAALKKIRRDQAKGEGEDVKKEEVEDAFDYKAKKGAIAAPGSGSIAKARKPKLSDFSKSIQQQMKDALKERFNIDDVVRLIQFGHPFKVVDEEIPPELPGPETRRYANVSNAVVDKADKKSNKAMAKAQKDTLVPTQTKEQHRPEGGVTDDSGYTRYPSTGNWVGIKGKIYKKNLATAKAKQQTQAKTKEKNEETWLEDSEWAQEKRKEKESSDRLLKIHQEREARYQAQQRKKREAQAKDKKDQDKDPVGKQHEGLKFKVDIKGQPPIYIAGKSASGVRQRERKIVKRPKSITSITRVMPSEYKKTLRQAAAGKIDLSTPTESVEIDELSKKTLGSYVKKAAPNLAVSYAAGATRVSDKRKKGINTAADKLAKEDTEKIRKDQTEKERDALTKAVANSPIQQALAKRQAAKKKVDEVAPPGWGHTVAKKEKTKPDKPKSKIGGTAHEFQKDLDSGKFKGLPGDTTYKDKKASMFKLMWSMKNKGDKPHYKPGVKDKLKSQYKEEVEESKLPPHLAKFFDKKGDMKPDVAKRVAAGRKKRETPKVTDVTPKGYGPNEDSQDLPGLGPKKKSVKTSKRVSQIYTGAQVSGEDNLLDSAKRYLNEKADWNTAFKSAAQSRPPMKYKDAVSFIDTAGLNSTEKRSALKAAKKWLR